MFSVFKKKEDFIEDELIASLKDDGIIISDKKLKKIRKGDDNEIGRLGNIYYFDKKDYTKAIKWYRRAAHRNNKDSPFRIGQMYQYGQGVAVDFWLAIEWYTKAVNNGNNYAAEYLGDMYYNGTGVVVDYKLAMAWYLIAEKNGSIYVAYKIGRMYHQDLGVAVDYKRAMEWYLKATNTIYKVEAANNIGVLYLDGLGVDVDYKQAMKWFQQADAEKYAEARSNIGWMYHNGYGVLIDYKLAMSKYQSAIKLGYLPAYTRIGLLYKRGLGISKDLRYAFECLQTGADSYLHTHECLYELAYFYEKEENFKNKRLAIEWYNRASVKGSKKAKDALKRLEEEGKRNREFQQNLTNRLLSSLTLNVIERESFSGNNETVPIRNNEQRTSFLSEKSSTLEFRMGEMEKIFHQKDNKIRELEEMLIRSNMEIERLHQKRRENCMVNSNNNNTVNNTNYNTSTKDNSSDINYDSPYVSDQDDASGDINYDTEVGSKSDSGSNLTTEKDINYDSN